MNVKLTHYATSKSYNGGGQARWLGSEIKNKHNKWDPTGKRSGEETKKSAGSNWKQVTLYKENWASLEEALFDLGTLQDSYNQIE